MSFVLCNRTQLIEPQFDSFMYDISVLGKYLNSIVILLIQSLLKSSVTDFYDGGKLSHSSWHVKLVSEQVLIHTFSSYREMLLSIWSCVSWLLANKAQYFLSF